MHYCGVLASHSSLRSQILTGPVYSRRQPEKTALFQVMQKHLLTFEQQWTDEASGRTLPKFVTEELHGFMSCGILGRGFAHLYCKTCREHHAVTFSCKARAVCPSCLGRRMSEGALNPTRRWGRRIRSWRGCSRLLPLDHRPLVPPTNASPSASCSSPTTVPWPRAPCAHRITGSTCMAQPGSPPTTSLAE